MTPDALTLQDAAVRASLSVTFLRRHLHDDHRPLPHLHMGRRVLVKATDLAAWMELFRDPVRGKMDDLMSRFRRDFNTD